MNNAVILEIIFIVFTSKLIAYLIVSSILGNNIFIKLFLTSQKKIMRFKFIRELEQINYFKLDLKDEKKKHIESINLYKNNRLGIHSIINKFTFIYNKRLYLIGIDIGNDILQIQKESGNDKWLKFVFNNDFTNKDFLDFANQIGLTITLNESIIFKEENEIGTFKFTINQNSYEICYPYLNDEILIAEFVSFLNLELTKIESENSFYLYNNYPTILFYADDKITNYLNKVNSEDNIKFLEPKKWLQTIKY
jgi:hypothetical protein